MKEILRSDECQG